MVKRKGRHTAAQTLRAASKALQGRKTISQSLNYRTPLEEHLVLRSEPAASVWTHIFFVLWSKDRGSP